MKIVKILNNNAVVVVDDQDREQIAIGTGVGFKTHRKAELNLKKVDKFFVLRGNEPFMELFENIPEVYFKLAGEIVKYAEKTLQTTFDDRLLLTLTDHISFTVERLNQGMEIKHSLLHEVEVLYPQEFDIGIWGINKIREICDLFLPVDEAAFIALHIHNFRLDRMNDKHETLQQTKMIQDVVKKINQLLQIDVEKDAVSFKRLVTHLQLILHKEPYLQGELVDAEMSSMIQTKFPISYKVAVQVCQLISKAYHITSSEEVNYLTIHIERIRKRAIEKR